MAKKKKETKKRNKVASMFSASGDKVERKNKSCPKCGPGVFLAKHKDRLYCGKCNYVEMTGSEEKEEKKYIIIIS